MWAKWKGNKRLVWVQKIIKQVQGGWKVDMRATTRNSKEATGDKIEAQGKGGANARYGKQQLDKKVSQGFKWSRAVTINPNRTQGTVKELKGPIAIPMSTTNPNQHTAAHLLSWLPLHNGKKERTMRKPRRKQKRQRKDDEAEDIDWHPIGNVEEVCAHRPEGLRNQLKHLEAEAEEMRYEGAIPTLLSSIRTRRKHPLGRSTCSGSRSMASDRSIYHKRTTEQRYEELERKDQMEE